MAFLADTLWRLLAGVPVTLELAACSVALGAVLAAVLALLTRAGGVAGWLRAATSSCSAARRCWCRSS